ncbi:MAG: four helix bundle protein [Muribaculaceae bacterium]|nr:four helix bundle protein [Muribaculaceae bacterium]
MDMIYHFERLEVFKQARQLVKEIYKLSMKFPSEERFALCSQLRRAAISIPSNIAEGVGRLSPKETTHFLEISYGSLMETYCQLQIALDLMYLTEKDLNQVKPMIFATSRMLNGLHKSFLSKQ